jgi:RNA polymerase sigma-70 factor, ECF subfamily
MRRADPLRDPEPLIRRVYSYIAYRVGDGPEAEDITSEVFERAVRYRHSFDVKKGEPIAWLLGIARSCIKTSRGFAPSALPVEREAIDGHEHASVERLTLASALATLRARDRELIALRYGSDLTAAQIGLILDMRPNAVEVALHRAVGRLRELLQEPEATRDPHFARS